MYTHLNETTANKNEHRNEMQNLKKYHLKLSKLTKTMNEWMWDECIEMLSTLHRCRTHTQSNKLVQSSYSKNTHRNRIPFRNIIWFSKFSLRDKQPIDFSMNISIKWRWILFIPFSFRFFYDTHCRKNKRRFFSLLQQFQKQNLWK